VKISICEKTYEKTPLLQNYCHKTNKKIQMRKSPLTFVVYKMLYSLLVLLTQTFKDIYTYHKNVKYQLSSRFPMLSRIRLRRVAAAVSVAISLPLIASYFNVSPIGTDASLLRAVETIHENAPKAPTTKYGFVLDSFDVVQDVFRKNQSISDLLSDYGLEDTQIDAVAKKSAAIFDIKKLQAGEGYLLLNDKKNGNKPQFMVYEPDVYHYVVYDLREKTNVYEIGRQVDVVLEATAAQVENDLWKTAEEKGLDDKLIDKMQDALKEAFDFHKVKKGDKFKLVYEQVYIEGKKVDVGDLKAVYFEKKDEKPYYAFKFKKENEAYYYDFDGHPYKQGFLQTPIKASRIASRFNPARLHPILNIVRAHTGTDYAAPIGSPIMSVADGVISQATNGGGKGNFVKVKHSGIYETEYYHMRNFAKGIKPGTKVEQGDIIGYVGMTGLTTGPHVCFHFWKNGKQVDHLKEKLPRAEPLASGKLTAFQAHRDSLVQLIEQSPYNENQVSSARP
jgi:murein DD-endopeptidase MepM/ murein hydrolase activator NlpD